MDRSEKSLRQWLDWQLKGGGAHAAFDDAVRGLPAKLRGSRPPYLPHTAWQLLEHMRLAQWDILDFSRNPKYKERAFPEGYWPKTEAPPAGAWEKSVRQFRDDLATMSKLVTNPKADLHAPIPWGDGQTILREALLAADHNSYHLGQLILVRRALGGGRDEAGFVISKPDPQKPVGTTPLWTALPFCVQNAAIFYGEHTDCTHHRRNNRNAGVGSVRAVGGMYGCFCCGS